MIATGSAMRRIKDKKKYPLPGMLKVTSTSSERASPNAKDGHPAGVIMARANRPGRRLL
jgi:hypothetical protein